MTVTEALELTAEARGHDARADAHGTGLLEAARDGLADEVRGVRHGQERLHHGGLGAKREDASDGAATTRSVARIEICSPASRHGGTLDGAPLAWGRHHRTGDHASFFSDLVGGWVPAAGLVGRPRPGPVEEQASRWPRRIRGRRRRSTPAAATRDTAGACFCGKKGACACPGECEPKGLRGEARRRRSRKRSLPRRRRPPRPTSSSGDLARERLEDAQAQVRRRWYRESASEPAALGAVAEVDHEPDGEPRSRSATSSSRGARR